MTEWRTIVAALIVAGATFWAVHLLSSSAPLFAAGALLIGAVLFAVFLVYGPSALEAKRLAASPNLYKTWITSAISLGGGAVVLFVMVWSLIRIIGGNGPNIDQTISLPLIVIIGLTVLLIVIGLLTFTFSVVGLSNATEALGLPDGSVRAIIALMLLVLFSILSIFLYNSLNAQQVQTRQHIAQSELDYLRSRAVIIHEEKEPDQPAQPGNGPQPAGGAAAVTTYTVTFAGVSGPADDIAKQLIVMLGTLVTAVASFYFGSASVASANAAVRGQIIWRPTVATVSPNPIAATNAVQSLTITGSNLGAVSDLHLEQKGQPDIDATLVKVTDTSLTAQITIPTGKTDRWDIVANSGSQATTIGTIDITAPAASPGDDSTKPKEAPPGQGGGGGAGGGQPAGHPAALAAAAALAAPASPAAPSATTNPAFLGHGIFLEYSPLTTLQRYATYKGANPAGAATADLVQRFIQAMKDMNVKSVWIQLFTASGTLDHGSGGTSVLVAGLKQANIAVAGWGYCYSKNAAGDAVLAKNLCKQYGIDAFIADVEPGNSVEGQPDTWSPVAFNGLIAGLTSSFGKDNLGISTFGNLTGHPDAAAIYKLAVDDVAFFAPQVYWYKKAPVDYMEQCIASFRQAGITTPLVGTAQSYWQVDQSTNTPRATMEAQVKTFVTNFSDWGKLIGLNWYHGGNANTDATGAMSDAMIASIAAAHLDQKAFAAPAATDGAAAAA
jgi:hypothetical protein